MFFIVQPLRGDYVCLHVKVGTEVVCPIKWQSLACEKLESRARDSLHMSRFAAKALDGETYVKV